MGVLIMTFYGILQSDLGTAFHAPATNRCIACTQTLSHGMGLAHETKMYKLNMCIYKSTIFLLQSIKNWTYNY